MKNKQNRRYLRTDMAQEAYADAELENGIRGIKYKEETVNGMSLCRLDIESEEGEKILDRKMGRYITLDVGRIWLKADAEFKSASKLLSREILSMIKRLCKNPRSILVVGLGNRYIASDSIGPLTVKGLSVTRHLPLTLNFHKSNPIPVTVLSALAPGVLGQTGIETSEIILGTIEKTAPSLLIAVDALAAKSTERLATTVQLSDSGISPGSGMGNNMCLISRETMGIPVISIGVPTVVNSSTMVCEMLERAGVSDIPDTMNELLENGKSFFVTIKDADIAAKELSRLISSAIMSACDII